MKRKLLLRAGAFVLAIAIAVFAGAAAVGMAFQFPRALDRVLVHEGGYANHPADPGGVTLEGITQRNYDAFLKTKGLAPRPLAPALRRTEEWKAHRNEIYRERYWDPVGGDGLGRGLDYTVFDYAVHSGTVRAGKVLRCAVQTSMPIDDCVRISRTWTVGDQIIAAAGRMDQAALIRAIWAERGRFHARLIAARPESQVFANGWRNRRQTGLALALGDLSARRADSSRLRALPGPGKAFDPHDPDDGEEAR